LNASCKNLLCTCFNIGVATYENDGRIDLPFSETEILVKLIRRGFLYAEVPHMLGARSKGDSKALTLKSLITLSFSFVRLFWQIHILRIEKREKYAQSYPPDSATYLAREKRDQRG